MHKTLCLDNRAIVRRNLKYVHVYLQMQIISSPCLWRLLKRIFIRRISQNLNQTNWSGTFFCFFSISHHISEASPPKRDKTWLLFPLKKRKTNFPFSPYKNLTQNTGWGMKLLFLWKRNSDFFSSFFSKVWVRECTWGGPHVGVTVLKTTLDQSDLQTPHFLNSLLLSVQIQWKSDRKKRRCPVASQQRQKGAV